MDALLDRIERELMAAARSHPHVHPRRRRRPILVLTAIFAVAGATAGIGAIVGTPVDQLLSSNTPYGEQHQSKRLDIEVADPSGFSFRSTTYLARNGAVATVTVPTDHRYRATPVGGAAGYVLADNLLNGPIAGIQLVLVNDGGRHHYAIAGTIDARAILMRLVLGGAGSRARISTEVLSTPVGRPAGLTAAGKRRLARMSKTVAVKAYVASFAPGVLDGETFVHVTASVRLADGAVETFRSGLMCVSRRCGAQFETPR